MSQGRGQDLLFWFRLCAFILCAGIPAQAQEFLEGDLPNDWAYELPSPEGISPASVEPGLSRRATPQRDEVELPGDNESLQRLLQPQYSTLFGTMPPQYLPLGGSMDFRSIISYKPPLGLRPDEPRDVLFAISPWVGLAQSFDSNVNLTPTDPIADLYLTPRAGLDFQLGTPDSPYLDFYDTIFAIRGAYEAYGDIFYLNPDLSAFNQKLELSLRIGRSAAIWRPFVYASDITGTDLLTRDLTNRTRRIRVLPGLRSEYQLSRNVGINHTVSYFRFQHPDPAYINMNVWRSHQEVTYLLLSEAKILAWSEYRFTQPDQGASGSEYLLGLGWAGKFDPRLFSELRIGWDFLSLESSLPGQKNLSGLRFNGYTTFQWSPRFAMTLLYDRDYVFNELGADDNYVSTLLQWKGEFFLGNSWYVTPYFGMSWDEFALADRVTLNWRPEIEFSYALPNDYRSNESRIYFKIGYQRSDTVQGVGEPIQGVRLSFGANWRF